ncbi:hypothetical protein ACSQ67_003210 [Phaseolus vulgaris]
MEASLRVGSKVKSMKEFIDSPGGSSLAKERACLSLSAVKALVLREKEDNLISEFSSNEKVVRLIGSLFDPVGDFLTRKINYNIEEIVMTSLPRDIHSAPSESLVVKLVEIIGNYKTRP